MFNNINDTERQRLQEIINKLIAVNFLVRELDRELYQWARRLREPLSEYFRFINWDFVFDDRHECIFVSSPESAHRRTLNREESIWLLIIRLIYQEKRQGLSLAEFPVATLHEIKTKYETFRLTFVNKTRLNELIKISTRYKLLEPLDADVRSDECRFRLFHTQLYAISTDNIEYLHDMLMNYESSEEGGVSNEMDEETATD